MESTMPPDLIDWLLAGFSQASVWQMVVYFLVASQVTMMTSTIYLHRSATHRGVDLHPVVSHFFRFWSWFTTAMVTKEWVAVHRKHHARCETAEDPHSPRFAGLNTVLWRGLELYQKAALDKDMLEKYGKGTPDDWIERNVYTRFSTLGVVILLFASLALFGLPGIAIWALQMALMPFCAAGVINGLGHWWGYRNFDTNDTATNLTPWALLIGGEELHNNHHAFPSSAKFALRRFEVDIGWTVVWTLQKLRLAKVLRVAPQLNVRPNISVPDADTLHAVMVHRWQVATDYFKTVLKPQLKLDAADLPRRIRNAFRSEGRWLDAAHRERLQSFLASRPHLLTLVEYRQRLLAIYEMKSAEAEGKMEALRTWCREAEASGIHALQEFSARLKGYALVPSHH
ncbi:MAG: fatty acid desaturase [Frankiaceae bacterium]|nr:fatty acid desaturase [Arenimonas sp.]